MCPIHTQPTEFRTERNRPVSLLAFSTTAGLTTALAITIDTRFYHPTAPVVRTIANNPTISPLNSFLYNSQSSNLATHGLHSHYQHLCVSIPLLLGPALYLFLLGAFKEVPRLPVQSAISGILLLSCIPHQEPRFLLPAIPLLLSSLSLPRSKRLTRYWLASWISFNAVLGILMGIYHQGGVVPAQTWLGQRKDLEVNSMMEVMWWRTYSPPIWLLDHSPINTTDLMGIPFSTLQVKVEAALGSECDTKKSVGLVAPYSSIDLVDWMAESATPGGLMFQEIWRHRRHLNLDDLDLGKEGVWGTLRRVVGRRGLVMWRVRRVCSGVGGGVARGMMQGDW